MKAIVIVMIALTAVVLFSGCLGTSSDESISEESPYESEDIDEVLDQEFVVEGDYIEIGDLI